MYHEYMAKIKKISYSDIFNIKKLISVVCNDNVMSYRRLFFVSVPTTYLQNLFYNVHLRRMPETYVAFDNNNTLKGLITVKAQTGNPYKWQIKRLFLDKNSFEEGKQLVEYIIAKFGARGVDTFYISVDDNNLELIDLFIKGCGFRLCSTEALWSVSNVNFLVQDFNENLFKSFKNEDSKKTAELYNENLNTLYKYSLSKEPGEFKDKYLQGLHTDIDFKYILEDEVNNTIKAFIEIKTFDNTNYFLDAIVPPQYMDLYPQILSFALKKISKRNKNFKMYIKNRKYLQSGDLLENFFKQNRFELLQNNAILVRDFFKTVKEGNKSYNRAIVFSGFEV